MKIRTIGICNAQVPFVRGGIEIQAESLQQQLNERGYKTEMIRLPFKWYPKIEIIRSALAWRFLDLTESSGLKIDLLICFKFPSYVVKHPNKVIWLPHQFRQIYDLLGTPYSDFTDSPEDKESREWIINIDNKTFAESRRIFSTSKNVANRLLKFNKLKVESLYPPPKHKGSYYNQKYGDYIFSAGRFDSCKRFELLIEAMRFTASKATCLIAGEGQERESLEKLAGESGVLDKVKFLGWVDDKELLRLYANAFAVFYAPFDEDYGYITVEAFESQKPVITTHDSGGPLEFVEDNQNGFITSGQPREIAAKIDHLYANKDLCRKFGMNGYDRVKNITWDKVIRELLCE